MEAVKNISHADLERVASFNCFIIREIPDQKLVKIGNNHLKEELTGEPDNPSKKIIKPF